MVLFIPTKIIDTRNAYKREAKNNLKELKSIMEKLVVKDPPEADTAFKSVKQGSSVWTYSGPKKSRTFAL